MPPNTDHARNKHIWTTICNFSQIQVITPWWWILCDPKHVGVIFNVSFRLLYNKFLTSTTVIFECIGWLINVTDNNDARWKPEINFSGTYEPPQNYRSQKCVTQHFVFWGPEFVHPWCKFQHALLRNILRPPPPTFPAHSPQPAFVKRGTL
jgi:hypothetical protein